MLVYGAIDLATALPLVIGLMGLGGLVFTALRFRRDDTTAVVDQQAKITAEMKTLNDELRLTADQLRRERDEARQEAERLRAQQGSNVARIERRNDA